MKRKNEEMAGELLNMRDVYEFLRCRPEHEGLEVLRRIRATASDTPTPQRIAELAEFVRHGASSSQSGGVPYLDPHEEPVILPPINIALKSLDIDLSNELPSLRAGQRRRYSPDTMASSRSTSQGPVPGTSINTLLRDPSPLDDQPSMDPRLCSAIRWINVTDDVGLVSRLIEQFYRWSQKYYHFLDWDLFLDDMVAGRTECCSSLLVHSVLALGCFHLPTIKNRWDPLGDNHLNMFYKEARRLWDLEEADSLTKIQSAMILYIIIGSHGRDKDGDTFLVEACNKGKALGLFDASVPDTLHKPEVMEVTKWLKLRTVVAWALFNFQSLMCYTYCMDLIINDHPSAPIPYLDDESEDSELFRSECYRHIIMLDITDRLWKTDETPRPEPVSRLYRRLKNWWDARSPSLDPSKKPLPENLQAAMIYHTCVIGLMRPFLNSTTPTVDADELHSDLGPYQDCARKVFDTSLQELRRLLTLHEVCHGWANTIPYILHPIMVTSFACVEELSRSTSTSSTNTGVTPATSSSARNTPTLVYTPPYNSLLTCLGALATISTYIYFAQPSLRLLAQTCQSLGVRLPGEVLHKLEMFKSEEWTKRAATIVRSRYVGNLMGAMEELDERRMDDVIKEWEGMSLGGDTDSQGNKGKP